MLFEARAENSDWIVVKKKAGVHVHPPEDRRIQIPRDQILLYALRDSLGHRIYPIHRLDAGTEGLILFSKKQELTAELSKAFLTTGRKHYEAVARGWTPEEKEIDIALKSDSTELMQESRTRIRRLAQIETSYAMTPVLRPNGTKHPTARYSLVHAEPLTGRYHQIRRHLNHISHPLIGDSYHGDTRQNRFFREHFQISGLLLWACRLRFDCPFEDRSIDVVDTPSERWEKVHSLFAQNQSLDPSRK